MNLKKQDDQELNTGMPYEQNIPAPPKQEEKFGYQQPTERQKPAYYESPAEYKGGPPPNSGFGTLFLVTVGGAAVLILAAILIFNLIIK